MNTIVTMCAGFVVLTLFLASAQTVRPLGAVTAIDTAANEITIKTDAGPLMLVFVEPEKTTFLRVAPGQTDLKGAARIALADVALGDRILARGQVSDDRKAVMATSVIVMSKSEIAKKQAADRAEWDTRGVAGMITALNPDKKEITISTGSFAGSKSLTIALADEADLRRYAPDSVKFGDARPSRFEDLQIGDQIRALGDKNEDGSRLTARELVSGSFLNIAAIVQAVDPAANTIEIMDLVGKKKLTVHVNPDSTLRRLPPFAAQMLAMRLAGGGPGWVMPPRMAGGEGTAHAFGAPGDPSGQRKPGGTGPGGPGAGMGRPRDLHSMIERMPPLPLSELKPGDSIIVASTKGSDPSQITAITLLAGVEPIFAAASRNGQQMSVGSWNLDANMGMGMGLP